jgi:hypothetical protein
VIRQIKIDRGFGPSQVLWGSRTHSVDCPAHKLELTQGLMGDGSTMDRHDLLFPGKGCGGPFLQVSLRLLALRESPRGHEVLHHDALFELMLDGV